MKNLTYGERLLWARKRAGLTQIQLAEASGVKQGTISKIERGDQNESAFDSILGHHLNINSYWLSTGEGEPVNGSQSQPAPIPQTPPYLIPPDAIPVRKIPLISWVNAGGWCESPDNHAPGDAEEWLDCPFPFSQHAFCLAVTGDSMWPEYREGEYILVDPGVEPLHGNDVVARTPDNKHTFKRLQITPEGTYLLALNPDHPNRKIEAPEGTHICGVVTGSWMNRRRK